ncbi:hypothetical protein PR202_gb07984 [Eleusine coracana subsp. coracana]|uniref:Glutathione S-transferase n=1 Tax=Eleusine coracana subsp. coracana TaxID=191504 RepID=A0AAV5EED0_ELECO|nr:hypothetical protein QOZ80_2BG0179780 [Eleusine coracana subsp. coracana]GJN20590.1 hypothetical protein PR202_gb07984 [Eleusine coracana subsp. coracana]
MASSVMKVLGGELSLFTARARLALELRGVPYELVEEPLGPRKSDRLLAANPVYGKIPVLLLPDGRAICESAVIVQYLHEDATLHSHSHSQSAISSRLLPDDPYERAMHRFWTTFVDDRFWPALDTVSLGPTREARAKALVDARAALQILEKDAFHFQGRRNSEHLVFFFSGSEEPGLLDVALGCFLPAIRACERLHGIVLVDASATPLLQRWSDRFAEQPAARTVLPETDKVVHFTKFLQDKFGVHLSAE